MDFFWVKHPKVESPAQVPETALPFWEGRGWERVDPPADPPADEPDTVEPAPEPKLSRAPRRQPATEE